jgi:transposase InsO family protein
VRFAFVEENRAAFPVTLMCEILNVSRNGYYDWAGRPVSTRDLRKEQLLTLTRQIFDEFGGLYGSPRVYAELKSRGVAVCENTVAELMRRAGLHASTRRRFVVRTTDSNHAHPVADNRLDRRFDDWELPDRAWCCDVTYIPTDEGWLYLAAVIDLASRRIVGWAMADHLRAELCVDALDMAVRHRKPGRGLLHHSDRGVQYACAAYQAILEKHRMTASMSRKGDCHDNAVMESFFGTLKRERVYQEHYHTREQATRSVFDYIEVFYNRKRRHSSLGYVSPVEYEAAIN